MKNSQPTLPPGFRFHPTDEELILHYLQKKVSSVPLPISIIAEVNIYKFNPWDLPAMAAFGEKEWYFFSPRDRKYPNGARPNRAAASGYWKATSTDKAITASSSTWNRNEHIGVKKALVFYKGRPPKGTKTNWIMHEYRLTESPCTFNSINMPMRLRDSPMRLDHWVLCRIYKRPNVQPPAPSIDQYQEEELYISAMDTKSPSLTTTVQSVNLDGNALIPQKSSSFSNLLDAMDYEMLSSFLSDSCFEPNIMSCLEPYDSTLLYNVEPNCPLHHKQPTAAYPDAASENCTQEATVRDRGGNVTALKQVLQLDLQPPNWRYWAAS
ncbi:hypothetical protein SAY86_023418 [Trapa natans]|uniref:NAC domain-containing protein n=1 Tax=Trapa natans TaxID=22666 RepID=A0AAN7M7M4_TRANT|nr:hypothetical protein SAY86_023418 [Trapa natans]